VEKREELLEQWRVESKPSVNLGCGEVRYADTLNCDMYGNELDLIMDARNLPFKDGSVEFLEAHHVLEHFGHRETMDVLSEWKRVLQDRGLLVISVPNMKDIPSLLTNSAIPKVRLWEAVVQYIYGNQNRDGEYHKAGFIPEQLIEMLMRLGFAVLYFWDNFPNRPTPSFCVIAKKKSTKEERRWQS